MSYLSFLDNFLVEHYIQDPLLNIPQGHGPFDNTFNKQRGAEELSPTGKATQGQYNEPNRQNDTDLTTKPIQPELTSPKPVLRLKLTTPDPFHPSNQMWTLENAIATTAQSPQAYTEWNSVPWPPPPEHLACLSLQQRITFSRVRSRIQKLRDPAPEIPYDRVFMFLNAQPQYREHPFNCTDKRLRENYGFSSPKPGETEENDAAPGADNDFTTAIMAECEHQEQLHQYRVSYRECVYSPLVSPMSTGPLEVDLSADDGIAHTGHSRNVSRIELRAESRESRASSCPPAGIRGAKGETKLKRKAKAAEEKVDCGMPMRKGIRIRDCRVKSR